MRKTNTICFVLFLLFLSINPLVYSNSSVSNFNLTSNESFLNKQSIYSYSGIFPFNTLFGSSINGYSGLFVFNTMDQSGPITGYSGLFTFNSLSGESITGHSALFSFNTITSQEVIQGYSGLFAFNTQSQPSLTGFSNLFTFNTAAEADQEIVSYSGLFVFNTSSPPIIEGLSSAFTFNTQGLIAYNLFVEIQPDGAGEVSYQEQYYGGQTVWLNATPYPDYVFLEWTDESGFVLSEEPEYSFVMPAEDLLLIAKFDLETSASEPQDAQVLVFPNPSSDKLFVEAGSVIRRISLSDASGRTVKVLDPEDYSAEITTAGFKEGLYIIRIFCDENVFTENILIIR